MIFSARDEAPIVQDLFPDWRAILGEGAARLGLEIGSGHGGFALAYAARHPERALVAVEQRRAFAAALAARAARRGLANLAVVNGDARLLAPRLFRPGSLAAVQVHFPDPWWKRKHHRRRLVDDGMAALLFRLLQPGGVLDLRTDVERYALEARERLEAMGFLNAAGPGRFAERDPDDIPSTREKRYLSTGQPVWRLRLVRPRA
ncbi:MAG TPA: tRNA (guanosine(46)-N7)-methyltransferase TrmB [Anaeromyxobacteraceae bacterium]|nr:tRNA (guanosine(46)-N7)-methyltransferase TrmB [Anaeromyxobacteraceae bacterium]